MYVPLWVTTEPNSMHGLTRTGRGFLRYLRIVVVNFLFLVPMGDSAIIGLPILH